MKLSQPSSSTSFYESFSDLIFATMLIFVFLTMILVLQVNPQVPQATRFTGGSDNTHSHIAHINVGGVPSVYFVPTGVVDAFAGARNLAVNDPLALLCAEAKSTDGLVTLPMRDFARLHGGMGSGFARGIRSWGEGTIETGLLLEAVGAGTSETPAALKARVFGRNTLRAFEKNELQIEAAWRPRYEAITQWLQTRGQGNLHAWIVESREPLRTRARGEGAWLRISPTELRTVRVGEVELTARQMRAWLRSIRAGQGFYVEVIDETGAAMPPPDWLREEVLMPTGFTARV